MSVPRRIFQALWAALIFGQAALFAADFVGSAACSQCHAAQYEQQSASHHAHALRRIDGSLLAATLLRAGQSPDRKLAYQQSGDAIAVHETGVPETPLLEWAFGAGVQGSTPVGHLDSEFFEHRFSYYSRIQNLAPTFGHPPYPATPIAELGVLQDKLTISRCFHCHGTGTSESINGPDLNHLQPGVQCERCHGPGSTHIQLAKTGASIAAVRAELVNPGRFPAKAQIEICGQCHRLPTSDLGDQPELADPVTVRFAPVGLLASRCFKTSGKLSCLTCHDPHKDAQPRTDMSYTEKCLGCHATTRAHIKRCRRAEKENCLPCHMKQASLGAYLRFTDHRIRVY